MPAMQFVPQANGKTEYVTSAANVSIIEIMDENNKVVDHKVKICYLDKYDTKTNPPTLRKEIRFSDGQQCKIYSFDELPMKFSAEDVGAEVTLRVKSEGSTIVEFLPENDDGLEARFVDFYRPNGADSAPTPFEKEKWNKNDPYAPNILQFCAKFKLEGGAFDGKFVFAYVQFSMSGVSKKEGHREYEFLTFPMAADGNVGLGYEVLPNNSTGRTWSDLVHGFRHCGLYDGAPIPYPEDGNPLPQIEKKLQQANKLVKLDIRGGYVKSIDAAKKMTMFQPKQTQQAQQPQAHEPGLPADNPDEM